MDFEYRGAGGTDGGGIRFFVGLAMLIGGGFLFFNSIRVTHHFGMGYSMFSLGGFGVTPGLVMVPFIFGIGMVFYNAKNIIGWILVVASIIMLSFGVISSINFRFKHMSAFELMMILTLFIGGIGTLLSSLRKLS